MKPRSATILNILLFSVLFAGFVQTSYAQETVIDGEELENVTITEDEARRIMKGLFDLPRLTHSLAIGKIARDERLAAYADGFMQRNHIEVLTIGYIDSEEFWPKVFRDQRLAKITKSDNDNLLAAKIIFLPMETDGTVTGYNCTLELTGKTSQVYELLAVSKDDIDLIATETSQQQLGSATYANPTEARETVVSALIAALQRVEETSGLEKEAIEASASFEGVRMIIVNEALQRAHQNIDAWQQGSDTSTKPLFKCFLGREGSSQTIVSNIEKLLDNVGELLERIDANQNSPTALRTATTSRIGKEQPHFDRLSEGIQLLVLDMLCEYIIEGVEADKIEEPYIAYVRDDYFLIDPNKKEFANSDTLLLHEYVTEFALYLKDPDGNDLKLDSLNFSELKGSSASPGFNLRIESLEKDIVHKFDISINDTIVTTLYLVKKVITQDISGTELDDYEDNADDGLDDGESWNPTGYACNNAVRAFMYYHNSDAVLFPETMPGKPDDFRYGSGLNGPDDPTVLKGDISWDGTADNIWSDFQGNGNDLSGSFTSITKFTTETWKSFFIRLQHEANKGSVIVGVVHSSDRTASRGHIVALTPKSLCSGIQRTLTDWKGEKKVLLPCAIEAGGNVKEIAWFKQGQSEVDKYKWFKYEN